MKFRYSAPAVMVIAVVLVVATISVVSYVISHRMVGSFEQTQFALMSHMLQSKFREAESKAIATAETIAAMPAVQKAFADKNRSDLLDAIKGPFAVQHEKYGINQAQFHVAPAESFLRVHRPETFGDDQAAFRQMVVEVNRVHSIRKGIEITTSGIGVFGTLPMSDARGTPVGSFEVGMEIGPLLDQLKKAYGFELALFIDEKMLRDTAKSMKTDIFSERNRVGPYVKFYSTHPELLRSLVTDADVNITEDASYMRDSGGVPYGVLLQPIYNYAKKPIGVVAMAANFSQTRSADGQAVAWQALLGVLSAILLTGVIFVVVRGLLLRPMEVLTAHITALADGEIAAEKPSPEDWCDEMKRLSTECERLTQRNRPAQGDTL